VNFDEFHKQLAATPLSFRRKLRDYLRHPTERMACYITGYVAALEDARLFKTGDAASYWFILIGRVEGNGALGCDLIAEMDAFGDDVQAAELEALRESLAALKAENEMLRKVQGAFNVWQARAALTAQDEALLRQALEALEVSTRFVYADMRPQCEDAIAALRERLSEKE
jgi:hypothetical protein